MEICGPDYEHDDQVMSDWLADMVPANFRAWIDAPDEYTIVAVDESVEVVGFGRMSRTGGIQMCYVVPEKLHQGFGKAILQSMEKQASQWGLDNVRLHSSITAKDFYERNGYRLTGEPKLFGNTLGDFPFAKQLSQ